MGITAVPGSMGRRGLGFAAAALWAGQAARAAVPERLSSDADALLRRLSDTLARAPSLTVDINTAREVRLEDGRVATLLAEAGIAIRRPDRLRADIRGDAVVANVFYDGRQVAIEAPLNNAYARAEAPNTLDATLIMLANRLGVPLEVGNLLFSNPYSRLAPDTVGEVVPSFTVAGRPAVHLIMQSGPVAWELWLEDSELALPLLASIRRGAYRTLVRFDAWRLGPQIPDQLFTFVPPPTARQIPMATRPEGDGP
ncbi:DUF2092 domain-containing protein [Roseococcus sp. YIM B11640]|uniref:DUF2092 domain-containing protein n=1 Tax=Roseococcus sp. YIM B11640 TaxID=3133973 RepID=UPI003C7D036D